MRTCVGLAFFALGLTCFPAGAQTAVTVMPHMPFLDATGSPLLTAGMVNNVCMADVQIGSDAGAKIAACATKLQSGGTIDARGLQGTGSASAVVDLSGQPFKLLLAALNLTVNGSPGIKLGTGSEITGVQGQTTITQGTLGNNVIGATSGTDIKIHDLSFSGISGAVSASSNSAIFLSNPAAGNISRVQIYNNDFTGFREHAVYLQNVSDASVTGNTIRSTSGGIRCSGCVKTNVSYNIVRDTQLPATIFTVAIGFDSTDPINRTSYPVSDRVTVMGNQISGYPNSQAILVHAGTNFSIVGNVMSDVLIGVSANTFNATDALHDIAIVGNTYYGTTMLGAPCDEGNAGIAFGGGGTAYTPYNITVVGNTVENANAVLRSYGQGGIGIGTSDRTTVVGNSIISPYGVGIYFFGSVNGATRTSVANNNITDVQVATSGSRYCGDGATRAGIYNFGAPASTGIIENNSIDNATWGVRFDTASTGMFIGPNLMTNVTTRIIYPSNVTCLDCF